MGLAVLSSACLKLPPDTDREAYKLDVINEYPYPLSVTVRHDGGIILLGVIPPGQSRQFDVRLWRAQAISVLATPLDNQLKIRRNVQVASNCIAQIVLGDDVRVGQPVVGLAAAPDSAIAAGSVPRDSARKTTRGCGHT